MKAFSSKIGTLLTVSILALSVVSCEKDDKLEAPENLKDAQIVPDEWRENTLAPMKNVQHFESLPLEGMYQKKVYTRLNPVKTQQYGSNPENFFELFEAADNHVPNRPMILLAPGGGWISYTEIPKLKELAEDLALRGYVVALIRYHVDLNSTAPGASFDVHHKSVRDVRSAVRYFKLNAPNYGINSDNIFIGGWSTGAVISMSAAYIKDEIELLEISEQPVRDAYLNSVNNLGYDSNDNPGVTSKVRGVLGMFSWMIQKTFIDSGEPSLMMINHAGAHLSNGTSIIGKTTSNGASIFGTDSLNGRALAEGFVNGQDLEYIRMSGGSPYKGSNEAALWAGHRNDIAEFFYRNMKK
jgi:hypothetical protein